MQSNVPDNCIPCYNVKFLNIFNPELQLINTKPMIELKKFKVQTKSVLDYKKRNDHKIFRSITKLIPSDSDIDEAFKSMHQSIMIKIKNYFIEDWVVQDVIIKHSIKIFECQYKENKLHKKWG